MGNKKTEAKKRNRWNRRRKAAKRPSSEIEAIYTANQSKNCDHNYAMEEQGFADFLDCGDN